MSVGKLVELMIPINGILAEVDAKLRARYKFGVGFDIVGMFNPAKPADLNEIMGSGAFKAVQHMPSTWHESRAIYKAHKPAGKRWVYSLYVSTRAHYARIENKASFIKPDARLG